MVRCTLSINGKDQAATLLSWRLIEWCSSCSGSSSRFVNLRTPRPVADMIALRFYNRPPKQRNGHRRSRAAMQSIAKWLEELGLGEYAQRFAENGIDFSVLGHLSDQDLKDLGVLLGHRRKLQAAIAGLAEAVSAPPKTAAAPITKPEDAAERRQLTVMFCDLVGSTALSAGSIPRTCARSSAPIRTHARARLRVTTASSPSSWAMGCWPISASRAPMRMTPSGRSGPASTSRPSSRSSKRARRKRSRSASASRPASSWSATLSDKGSAQEQAVVGETPNLAARLQALAEPGSVVIAEATRRLLGGAFELKALGPQVLKGFGAAVPAWAVLREAENVSRFEASRSQGMTPFVGREHEVALLLDRWRDAAERRGPGRVALGRSRHRQVAHSRGVARADRRRAACDDALSMLAAPRQ